MKKFRRTFVTLLVLLSVFATSALAAPSVNELKDQKEKAEAEMNSLKAELTEILEEISVGFRNGDENSKRLNEYVDIFKN